jgi:hypothetical protein
VAPVGDRSTGLPPMHPLGAHPVRLRLRQGALRASPRVANRVPNHVPDSTNPRSFWGNASCVNLALQSQTGLLSLHYGTEGHRFESCRARQRKACKSAGFGWSKPCRSRPSRLVGTAHGYHLALVGAGSQLIVEEQGAQRGRLLRDATKPANRLSPNRFQALAASVSTFALPEDRA